MGWLYDLKLHRVINDRGELLACQITSGNVDDRKPVPALCKRLFGKLIADRGYISQNLFEQLLETFNLQLITRLRKNIKNRLIPLLDKVLLRKRAIIESVIDQLKNISQIEHTRHRSLTNAFVNLIAGLIAPIVTSRRNLPWPSRRLLHLPFICITNATIYLLNSLPSK